MPILPIDQGGTGADTAAGARSNLGFPSTANRYLRNDGSGVPAALGATETANLDALAGASPKPAFSTKTAAAAYNPGTVQVDVLLTGSSFSGSVGRTELFVDAGTGSDPTDLPAPAFVRLADGRLKRWSGRTFPLELGAKGDNSTDNSNFFEDVSNSMTAYTGVIEAGPGTFKTNKPLKIPRLASLIGQGPDKTVFTAAGSTGTFGDAGVVVWLGGAPVQKADLDTDLVKGTRSMSFGAAHGRSVGSDMLIYNSANYSGSLWRGNYRSGEFVTASVIDNANDLKLERGILGSGEFASVTGGATISDPATAGTWTAGGYDKDDVDIYHCDLFASGTLQGFAVVAPGPGTNAGVHALRARYVKRSILRDLHLSGGEDVSCSVLNFYRGIITNCVAVQRGAGDVSYGLIIGSSQDVSVDGYFEGRRQGISLGGDNTFAIFNRHVHVHDFTAVNGPGPASEPGSVEFESLASAGWHGNVEYCSYTRGRLFGGGVNCTGNHNSVDDIEWMSEAGYMIYGGELTGMDHSFTNLRGYTRLNDPYRGLIDLGGDGPAFSGLTRQGGTLKIHNIKIEAPNHTGHGIKVCNRGMTGTHWGVQVGSVDYTNAQGNTTYALLSTAKDSGDVPNFVQSDGNLNASKAVTRPITADAGTKIAGLSQSGTGSVPASTSVSVVSVDVPFSRPFPRTPHISLGLTSFTSGGADRVMVKVDTVSSTGFTMRFLRADTAGANFTSTATLSADWTATLQEI